jgi:signal transduction histidine kinase
LLEPECVCSTSYLENVVAKKSKHKLTMKEILTNEGKHPARKVSLQKRVEIRRLYIAQIPRWRHPLVGYLASLPIVAVGVALVVAAKMMFGVSFVFPGLPPLLSILLIALLWGMGPALFSVAVSALALDYFYLPPLHRFDLTTLQGAVQVLPFVAAGLIVAIITGQRESARLNALLAEQDALERADELERANREMEQANKELEQANRLKDQFLSMASHELKTPITVIRGHAQIAFSRLLKRHEATPESAVIATALQRIDEQTQRLTALVDDLLDLSSLRAGKLALNLDICDLVQLCNEAVENQRLLTGRNIEMDAPPTPIEIQGDANRLSQVVINLLSNALKYSAVTTPVIMRVQQNDSVAIIAVQDFGKGIPYSEQKHIFEAFYRTAEAQKQVKRGMGLGLAISKDIIERHGGRIRCDSTPGEGSTFIVELPLHALSGN